MRTERRQEVPATLAKSVVHAVTAEVWPLMKRRYHLIRDISKVENNTASSFKQTSCSGFASVQKISSLVQFFFSTIDMTF